MTFPEIMTDILNGRTQAEFAKEIGVTRASISSWERGKTEPKFEHVLRLLEIADREQKEGLAECFGLREVLQTLINELGVRAS